MSIIRDITIKAQGYLKDDDILLFTGARQAGKTTILRQLAERVEKKYGNLYFLNLEDPDYRSLLNQSPKNLFKIFTIDLKKRNFIFIDEVQYLNDPSNFLKYMYDEYRGRIKLLVSGSSAFYIDRKFKDSLAGRKRIFHVKTLSFREYLRFKNETDILKKDFRSLGLSDQDRLSVHFYEYMTYGGYPRIVLASAHEKTDLLSEIAYSYIKKDIYEASIRQEDIFYKLFKILSSQTGNLVNFSELAHTLGVSKTAIDNYLYVMQKSFHIALVKPFYKNIRKELTKMPKVYFFDTGLRNFFVSNFKSFVIRDDQGALLENMVFRQLIEKYPVDEIRFWRTSQGQEIDFIADAKEAIEVKASSAGFKEGSYRVFSKHYSDMAFHVISMEIRERDKGKTSFLLPWQL
jgi:predicted AAA+ superfamily ATPase